MSDRALTRALKAKELAEYFGVDIHTPPKWVKSGAIKAINVGQSSGKRPQYRFTPEAIAEFELARQINPAPVKSTRRRKPAEHQFKYY